MDLARSALTMAIDGYQATSRMRRYRGVELTWDLNFLLLLICGDSDAEAQALEMSSRPRETVRKAAEFFVEQVLFAGDADAYQTLGSHRQASSQELRRNMALILRWLHPDLNSKAEAANYSARVTAAWNQVKTPDLRRAYDLTLEDKKNRQPKVQRGKPERRSVAVSCR